MDPPARFQILARAAGVIQEETGKLCGGSVLLDAQFKTWSTLEFERPFRLDSDQPYPCQSHALWRSTGAKTPYPPVRDINGALTHKTGSTPRNIDYKARRTRHRSSGFQAVPTTKFAMKLSSIACCLALGSGVFAAVHTQYRSDGSIEKVWADGVQHNFRPAPTLTKRRCGGKPVSCPGSRRSNHN